MWKQRRMASVLLMLLMFLAAGAAIADEGRVSVLDADGREAVMTSFVIENDAAWWAQLPQDSPLDGIILSLEGADFDGVLPGSGAVLSAPDAGSSAAGAAYIALANPGSEDVPKFAVRVYVSHEPYSPLPEPAYRNVRAVGQWGRISGTASLQSEPAGETLGSMGDGTRVFVLYTCRLKGTDYACVRSAGETCFVRADSLRMLSAATNAAFDATILSERRKTDDVRFARADYQANMRRWLGNAKDAVVDSVPVCETVLVLTSLTYDKTEYDLVYRLPTSTVGFVHGSQLSLLDDAETAAQLAGETSEETGTRTAVTIAAAELRVYPSSDAQTVGELPAGTPLTVFADIETPAGVFCLVQAGEQLGYVPVELIGFIQENAPQLRGEAPAVTAALSDALYGETVAVTVREALVYAGPAFDAATVTRIARGTRLTAVSRQTGWLEVRTDDGGSGWLPDRFTQPLRLGDSSEDGVVE